MEGTIGEIRMFAGTFAPKSWAFCNGQIMSIAQNTAMFSILGTTYGGNGTTTYALPDLRARTPVGVGTGPGLSNYNLGQITGSENTTLLQTNMPAHSHAMMASANGATQNTAGAAALASGSRSSPMPNIYASGVSTPVAMATQTSVTGNSQPFGIIQPSLAMNYIICQYGIYPSRN